MLAVDSRNVQMTRDLYGSDANAGTAITKCFTLGHSKTVTMVVFNN
jgi:hypothetical protein